MSFLGCSSTMLLCLSGVSSWSLQEFSVCVLITTSKRTRSPECVVHAFRGLSSSVMIPRSRLHVNTPTANARRPAGCSLSPPKSTVWVFSLICFEARARTCDGWFPCTVFIKAVEWVTCHHSNEWKKTICIMLWRYRRAGFEFTLLMKHKRKYYTLSVFKLADKLNLL